MRKREYVALPGGKEIWREERCFDSRGFEVGCWTSAFDRLEDAREGHGAEEKFDAFFSDGAIYPVSLS